MHDGQFKRISISDDIEVGMVLREIHNDATVPPFADAVVLKRIKDGGDMRFLIARPYCFVSSSDTTCPTPLTGVETFEARFENLRNSHVVVLTSRGNPFVYTR